MGLPKNQLQFLFQLTGFSIFENIDVASTTEFVTTELKQAVSAMSMIREYLIPLLAGDNDSILFQKLESTNWENKMNLTNTRNSHLNVCGIQWTSRKDKQNFSVNGNVFETKTLGNHCEIYLCR